MKQTTKSNGSIGVGHGKILMYNLWIAPEVVGSPKILGSFH
jgi:hypothetical protein